MARYWPIDLWRGLAVIGMVVFHVAVYHDATHHSAWTDTAGVSAVGQFARTTFVFLLGFSAALARARAEANPRYRRNKRRLLRTVAVAAGALFVSVASAGQVRFGILHYMTVAGLVVGFLPTAAVPWAAFAAALLVTRARMPRLGHPLLDEVLGGYVVHSTCDLFPLLRWLPVSLLGLMAGLLARSADPPRRRRLLAPVCWLGTHSLSVYVAHLILLSAIYRWVPGRTP